MDVTGPFASALIILPFAGLLCIAMMMQVSEDGAPLWTLQDPGGKVVPMVTSVTEHEGKLYMGNLAHSFVAELDLSVVSTAGSASEEVSARDEE